MNGQVKKFRKAVREKKKKKKEREREGREGEEDEELTIQLPSLFSS